MEQRDNRAGGSRYSSAARALIERQSRDPQELRDTYQGFGDGLALAFEIAFVPAIMGFIGYGLDRWVGTLPVLTVLFAIVGVVGLSIRLWYDYDARMKVHEAEGPWAATSHVVTPEDAA